jgi:hypothetical protein
VMALRRASGRSDTRLWALDILGICTVDRVNGRRPISA